MGRLWGIAALAGLCCGLPGATPLVEHGNVAFDISPDGEQVAFAAADGDLYLLQLKTSQVSPLTRTPRQEYSPAFSPDGRFIIYAADVEGRKGACLFVLALSDKKSRQLTDDSSVKDGMPSYSRDGSQIVFTRAHRHRPYSLGGWTWDDWDVCLVNSDGSGLRRLTQQKYYGVSSPKFLPTGSNIVYSADADRVQSKMTPTLFVVDAATGKPPTFLAHDFPSQAKGGAWASGPDVSVEGSIVLVSDRVTPFQYDVFTMDGHGMAPKPLGVTTTVSRYNRYPTFLPGGRRLLFLAGREWNANSRPIFSLWMVNTDGTDPQCVAESMLFTDPLHWKPNR